MHTVAVRETVVSDILSIFSSLHTGLYNRFRLRFEFQVKTYELQYKTDIFENRLFRNQSDHGPRTPLGLRGPRAKLSKAPLRASSRAEPRPGHAGAGPSPAPGHLWGWRGAWGWACPPWCWPSWRTSRSSGCWLPWGGRGPASAGCSRRNPCVERSGDLDMKCAEKQDPLNLIYFFKITN